MLLKGVTIVDGQTDRKRNIQTDRQTDRQMDTHRKTDGQIEGEIDRYCRYHCNTPAPRPPFLKKIFPIFKLF